MTEAFNPLKTGIQLFVNEEDSTGLLISASIEGSMTGVSRALNFSLVSSPTDPNVPVIDLKVGDEIELKVEEANGEYKTAFEGLLYNHEMSITANEITVTCHDCLFPISKSTITYNFKGKTPGQITKQILEDQGIPFGGCVIEGEPLDRLFEEVNSYDAIMTVWTLQSQQDKKIYSLVVRDGKACVVEKGKTVGKYILDPETSIINATYSESAEDVISIVNLYDESNNKVGQVKLKENPLPVDIQLAYKHSDENEDAVTAATKMLKGISRNASVEILGDVECMTGRAVVIQERYTGLYGLFFIDADTHTFENRMITTSLELSFENTMDEKDVGGLEQEEVLTYQGGEWSGMTGNTTREKVWSFFKSKGFSNAAIAGILGNLQQESGIDPSAIQGGGRGPGHGIMQWEGGRLTQLRAYAQTKGKAWNDLGIQLEFMYMEMVGQGPVDKYSSSLWSRHGGFEKFKSSTNVREATRMFEAVMERAGRPMMERRYDYAEKIYNDLKNWNPNPAPASAGGHTNIARNQGMLNYGKTRIGNRYLYGAASASGSIDCSGFVWRSMQSQGYKGPRFSTGEFGSLVSKGVLQKIPMSQKQPGDIMWMSGHTGFYYGDGKSLEATPPKVGIYSFNNNRWTAAYRWTGKER